MTFSRYFVTDSLCCPSRVVDLHRALPHNTGVFTNTPPDGGFSVFHDRGEESDTFATAISGPGADYRTAMMGKYLNGYVSPVDSLYVPPGWSEWDVAGNGYPEFNYNLNENGKLVALRGAARRLPHRRLAGKGVDFIDRAAKAGNRSCSRSRPSRRTRRTRRPRATRTTSPA